MAQGEIHVGDIGTALEVEVLDEAGDPVDLTSATVKTIKLLAPSGGVKEFEAEVVGDAEDGVMRYVTDDDADLDEDGLWQIQGYVEIGDAKWHSDRNKFKVFPNIESEA